MEEPIELPLKKEVRDPNKTYYKVIEHKNSNKRQFERVVAALAGKNLNTISYQVIRDGPRPVDTKRRLRAEKKKAKYIDNNK